MFTTKVEGATQITSNGDFKKAYGKEVRYLSFGDCNKYLIASTFNGLDLYSNFDSGNATLEQTADNKVLAHKMSKDGSWGL